VTTYSGTGVPGFADGASAQIKFRSPRDVAIDENGNIYVADYGNHRIRKILKTGELA
jgi:DNA-binding beta-propeller fold protein YncE